MKTKLLWALGGALCAPLAGSAQDIAPAAHSTPIPLGAVGVVAGQQYHGDGLSVTTTADGARLRCVFQRLEGQATPEGLWLTSTSDQAKVDRFRVVAIAVGRMEVAADVSPLNLSATEVRADSRRLLRCIWAGLTS